MPRIVHSIDELAEALAEGGDPADLTTGDGVYRDNPDQARAAEWATNHDHLETLRTGGRLDGRLA